MERSDGDNNTLFGGVKAGHKSGFVNIVGNPNVGKSTLMNKLVGDKVSIITSKAQTTRHRIMGIVNTPEMQIVYSDTPGVLKPQYKLQDSMLGFSRSALGDADILLYVTDTVESGEKNEEFLAEVRKVECPVFVLINKADLSDPAGLEQMVKDWQERLPQAEVVPLSAYMVWGCSTSWIVSVSSCRSRLPTSRRMHLRIVRRGFLLRRSSVRRSCCTTRRRSLTLAKWSWRASRRAMTSYVSMRSYMWSVTLRRESS